MLTLEEAGWSLCAFKICSILNIFPIEVDVKRGKIQRQSSKSRVFIWKFSFGICIFHWLYMFARLVQSATIDPQKYFRWDHFVLHFGLTSATAAFYFTVFRLFVRDSEENVIVFNQLFEQREDAVQKMMDRQLQDGNGNEKRGNEAGRKSAPRLHLKSARVANQQVESQSQSQNQPQNQAFENEPAPASHPRPLLAWPPKYSLDELLAKLVPMCAGFPAIFCTLFLAIDPSRPQLLYSVLPPEYQSVWSFLTLLPLEALWITILGFNAAFVISAQVLFFGKCQQEFERLNFQLRNLQEKFQNGVQNGVGHIRTEIWILRQIFDEMRELVVLIELFNRVFPFCIFAWKISCFAMAIIFYFFVIRFKSVAFTRWSENPHQILWILSYGMSSLYS